MSKGIQKYENDNIDVQIENKSSNTPDLLFRSDDDLLKI